MQYEYVPPQCPAVWIYKSTTPSCELFLPGPIEATPMERNDVDSV